MSDAIVTAPPGPVAVLLTKAGLRAVSVPVTPGQLASPVMWIDLDGAVVTWQEACDRVGARILVAHRQALIKPFWRTSEFWLALATAFTGFGTTLIAALQDGVGALGHPWDKVLMSLGTTLGMAAPIAYRFMREYAKQMAGAEIDARSHTPVPQLVPPGAL